MSQKLRRQLYSYKGNRCAACGLSVLEMMDHFGTFDRMFEFNHVEPAKKHPDYDNLIRRILCSEQLVELDKCILLCRNCHGIVHAQSICGQIEVVVRLGRRQTAQKLTGQVIVNRKDRHIRFLTSDRLLAIPYRVKVGSRRPTLMFGTELVENHGLANLLRALRSTRKLVIKPWQTDETLLSAEYVDSRCFNMTQSVKCDLLKAVCCLEDPANPYLWVRNGLALTKDGDIVDSGQITYQGVCYPTTQRGVRVAVE